MQSGSRTQATFGFDAGYTVTFVTAILPALVTGHSWRCFHQVEAHPARGREWATA
jgi:hypothetical protein